jgi:hypothetical protein
MPRRIGSYRFSDWLRLRPLTQGYKTLLLNRLDRRYTRRPPEDGGAFLRLLQEFGGRNVIISIAFNSAWTIRWQLHFVRRHLRNAAFLVADNSTDPAARAAIAALCAEAGIAYLALPPNPYRNRGHASRSHGLALNWVYRNLVRRLSPAVWGFLDHDLFPTRPFDPVERLRGQPFYGHLEVRVGGRYLWPGYCLFARDADRDALLDFRQDWFIGLDTGGMNAAVLERRARLDSLVFADSRSIGPDRYLAVTIDDLDWFDDCIHLGNGSSWYRANGDREPALDALLRRIDDGSLDLPDRRPSGHASQI